MIKRRERTFDDCIRLHIADGRAPVFEDTIQRERILKARALVEKCLGSKQRAVIIELGCGSGDVSGPFSGLHTVYGFDVTAESKRVAERRFPWMQVTLTPIEQVAVFPCDCLVLCETLEHLADPLSVVRSWLPMADTAVIGHPLNEPIETGEEGHTWSYTLNDFLGWFATGKHVCQGYDIFPMAIYPEMVIGWSRREL